MHNPTIHVGFTGLHCLTLQYSPKVKVKKKNYERQFFFSIFSSSKTSKLIREFDCFVRNIADKGWGVMEQPPNAFFSVTVWSGMGYAVVDRL